MADFHGVPTISRKSELGFQCRDGQRSDTLLASRVRGVSRRKSKRSNDCRIGSCVAIHHEVIEEVIAAGIISPTWTPMLQ